MSLPVALLLAYVYFAILATIAFICVCFKNKRPFRDIYLFYIAFWPILLLPEKYRS